MSSNNNNNTAYTLAIIHEALTPSSLGGVMQLATGIIIKVDSAAWKECLTEINEACAYGWRIFDSNRQKGDVTAEEAKARNISLCFSQQHCCHRVGTYKIVAKNRPVQKKSKKVDCKCTLHPFDCLDCLHEILQQFQNSSKAPRQIRVDMLKAADTFGRKSHRKINYHDIWNIMNKVDKELYHFHKDHMGSFRIWMDQKLPKKVFIVLLGDCLTLKTLLCLHVDLSL
ncbi:hypothetical protein RO3G_00466 [Rhizopus delemar RA 99-880]|uniref:SWIM-type domain-containing protein n=1 Tax=Rhizopus delemar (strain RA 99-880 / ATCC MYA-4621 / FGSC 9543 / NRRL 43880) TaxID=246409 RepID=I1BHT2_RHIO9|nr:hypothetical protein RO3G_00466 [Rhizopus delemar RA 99-880]|eukprot:EIE75762.1 hypothetical protein RO3G_00466 [Rhizopus delemar RA 99-880]